MECLGYSKDISAFLLDILKAIIDSRMNCGIDMFTSQNLILSLLRPLGFSIGSEKFIQSHIKLRLRLESEHQSGSSITRGTYVLSGRV